MTDDLDGFEITPLPESAQLRFRFRLRGKQRQVEFVAPFHTGETMIRVLQQVQQRYKLAKAQHSPKRGGHLRLVKKDDDQS